jgi:methyl acetate hydrolase
MAHREPATLRRTSRRCARHSRHIRAASNGRSAGSISWAGLLNCYFWLDPVKHVTGALFTQVLPFFDERVVALYGEFERGLYAGLA